MNERDTIDRGWFYVTEPDAGRWAPDTKRIHAPDGAVLTRRLHGHPSRVEVIDASGADLPAVTLLRAAAAVGHTLEAALKQTPGHAPEVLVTLGEAGTALHGTTGADGRHHLVLDGPWAAALPSHHPLEAALVDHWQGLHDGPARWTRHVPAPGALPDRPVPAALFFESLMNTDMPHNDKEISQGVLHLVSPLADLDTQVVMVNVKMPIEGDIRPVHGLHNLTTALAEHDVQLVAITLLEGYWHGVVKLIATLRSLGCRARIAVGGVMPSLAPEHVAAHLPDVSFVCRGAGEVFLPKLARILGDSTVDDPFTPAQTAALLAMDGMIAVDHSGPGLRLLSCRSDRTLRVEDLSRVPLDLSHLHARHIEGGIEIATSRGCIHKCSFCSILGRESYQARSSGSIFGLLNTYVQRFRELYGDDIPSNAYRMHISDDDFACERDRTIAFFRGLKQTPFRLSSVQVAVGDLLLRKDGKLTTDPDHELLDAMDATCFADHGRPIPIQDHFEDHKSRTWSSFLQIGVETYSDREIARLGKGYKRVHVRTMVAELARRGLHMDGYFILCNADTTADDLVEVFSEVARLKLRYPRHFHMRFPVVQRLVSYFTAASHRRHVRKGRRHVMDLRDHAQVPGHAEYDYPFVEHDIPTDAVVADTVDHTFVTDEGLYTGNLTVLGQMWRARLDSESDATESARLRRLIRATDDRRRWLVFELLRQAWRQDDPGVGDQGWPHARLDREAVRATAERVLGPSKDWIKPFRTFVREPDHRRVVVHAQHPDGSLISDDTWAEAATFALSTNRATTVLELVLGQGPVDGTALAQHLHTAREAARTRQHRQPVRFKVDVAGLTPADVATLAAPDVQFVAGAHPDHAPARPDTLAAAASHDLLVVLHPSPDTLAALPDQVRTAATLGAAAVSIQPAATAWSDRHLQAFAKAVFAVAPVFAHDLALANHTAPDQATTLGKAVAVAPTGHILRADGLRLPPTDRDAYRLATLSDLTNVDRHAIDLADPASTPRLLGADATLAKRQPALQVLAKFGGWLSKRRQQPASA